MALSFNRSPPVRMGFLISRTRQFSGGVLQKIPVRADVDGGVGDDLLPQGVDGRVGHLGKELLEIAEQGLLPLGEDGQGNVRAHGHGRLVAAAGHGEDGLDDILIGIAEDLVELIAQGLAVVGDLSVGGGQVPQAHQRPVQPLAIGMGGGIAGLDAPRPPGPGRCGCPAGASCRGRGGICGRSSPGAGPARPPRRPESPSRRQSGSSGWAAGRCGPGTAPTTSPSEKRMAAGPSQGSIMVA